MRKARSNSVNEFGLSKVIGVSILLISTRVLSPDLSKASALQVDMIALLEAMNMPAPSS